MRASGSSIPASATPMKSIRHCLVTVIASGERSSKRVLTARSAMRAVGPVDVGGMRADPWVLEDSLAYANVHAGMNCRHSGCPPVRLSRIRPVTCHPPRALATIRPATMVTPPVPSRRQVVNPVRPGREQRQQRTRVPGCGWSGRLQLPPERCPSGLRSTPGKCVWVNSPSRVRIPPSPPIIQLKQQVKILVPHFVPQK